MNFACFSLSTFYIMAVRQFKNTYMSHDTFLLGHTALELQLLQDSTFF